MEHIKLGDIDLSKLQKYKIQGTKSTIYHDGEQCVKMLDKLYPSERDNLYKKFMEMDGIDLEDVLLPKELIVDEGHLVGYTMDDFKSSINILDYLTATRYIDAKDILKVVKEASLILRKIHEKGIVCQDLSFDNILIDASGKIKYSDIDGCAYKDYMSPFMSVILKRYLFNYRKDKICYMSKNTDRISFMLSFFVVMYLKELQKLTKKKYHVLSDKIETLENCREYANLLLSSESLPQIPYLDELIADDSYLIDRNEQLGLIKRLLR